MRTHLKVAGRGSPLSLAQIAEVSALLRQSFQIVPVKTYGDLDKKTSLRNLDKTDFFTREVDELVLNKTCDFAVHSAKDLPARLPIGLKIVALTQGEDPSDSLVLREGISLDEVRSVATSSHSREKRARLLTPHARFVDVRGTIEERLRQLEEGRFDAVVIAEAALKRLKLAPPRFTLPGASTPLQGQLALVARDDDPEMERLLSPLDCRPKKTLYLGLRCPNPLWHHYPLIKTTPLPFTLPEKPATHYLFTSQTAVDYFYPHLQHKPIFSVGAATSQKLQEYGFSSERAEKEQQEGIIELLEKADLSGAHIVWPRSAHSRETLSNWFKAKGVDCTEIPLYTTAPAPTLLPNPSLYEEIHFTSPSTVEAYLKLLGPLPVNKKLVALGPITQNVLDDHKRS